MLLTYSSDSILVKSVLVGLLVPAAVWLFVRLITASLDFWEKINPPCNLPVLNLEGWQFAKAKHEYLTDLGKYLQIGRNLVCSPSSKIVRPFTEQLTGDTVQGHRLSIMES